MAVVAEHAGDSPFLLFFTHLVQFFCYSAAFHLGSSSDCPCPPFSQLLNRTVWTSGHFPLFYICWGYVTIFTVGINIQHVFFLITLFEPYMSFLFS